jgi:hypothetical protein
MRLGSATPEKQVSGRAEPGQVVRLSRCLLISAAVAIVVAMAVAGCNAGAGVSTPASAADAYLALATSYNQALTETNQEIAAGHQAAAFLRLAKAEHDFGAGLDAIPFPASTLDAARRLREASRTLEGLYGSYVGAAAATDQAALVTRIAAARAASSEAAAALRAALGLPPPS